MRRSRLAGVLLLAIMVTSCSGEAEPRDQSSVPSSAVPSPGETDDGAPLDEFCASVHIVFEITAEATAEGVALTWLTARGSIDPVEYVIYRRPEGSETWDRVAEVTVEEGGETAFLDTSPAEERDTAYEYSVTKVDPGCGGESEICPDGYCTPPAIATPLQD
jgi:hypothetical protein